MLNTPEMRELYDKGYGEAKHHRSVLTLADRCTFGSLLAHLQIMRVYKNSYNVSRCAEAGEVNGTWAVPVSMEIV